jgi:hypothetical protein
MDFGDRSVKAVTQANVPDQPPDDRRRPSVHLAFSALNYDYQRDAIQAYADACLN